MLSGCPVSPVSDCPFYVRGWVVFAYALLLLVPCLFEAGLSAVIEPPYLFGNAREAVYMADSSVWVVSVS